MWSECSRTQWLCATTLKAALYVRSTPWRGWQLSTVPVCPLTTSPCRYPKRRCLHHQPLFVFSVGKRSSTEWTVTGRTVHCIHLPRHWAACQIAPAASAVCQYKALSVHCSPWIKVFYFTVVAFCRELLGVPSGEGSGLWFSPAKCSASLPSKPDLETCLLSTHGESSLKFHGT